MTVNTGMVKGEFFDDVGEKLRATGREIGVGVDKASTNARATGREIGVEVDKASTNARATGREIGVETDKASKNARATGREIGVETDKVTNPQQETPTDGEQKVKKSGFVDHIALDHKYKVNKDHDNWKVTFGQRTHVRHYTGKKITPCTLYWKQPDNRITTVKKGQWLELQLKDSTWIVMTAADHRS
jgi:hypothetical protein